MSQRIAIICLLVVSQTSMSQGTIRKVMDYRAQTEKIHEVLEDALLFLSDRQIRDLPGKQSCLIDYSEGAEGCRSQVFISLSQNRRLPIRSSQVRQAYNIPGVWPGMIHPLPHKLGKNGRSILHKADFCHFIPMSIAYPLLLLDESSIPTTQQIVLPMLQKVWQVSGAFKRGAAYNFWLPKKYHHHSYGPSMVSLKFMEEKAWQPETMTGRQFWRFMKRHLPSEDYLWFNTLLNPDLNPDLSDSFFNIPNDADDTALAVSFQQYRKQLLTRYPNHHFFGDRENYSTDSVAIQEIIHYRDKKNGAYQTWLKEETPDPFDHPNQGIIPYGKNNIDGVVNANVLFALGLFGSDYPGMKESAALLVNFVQNQEWPECSLYYPQLMLFPYAISRAWRDGRVEELEPVMITLMKQVLALGEVYRNEDHGPAGSFPGGEDVTDHLSTALALSTLMNIGRQKAVESGIEKWYDRSLREGISYLIREADKTRLFNTSDQKGYRWDSGLYFSSSYWDMAHWHSEAFTAAMVAEALTKYLLAWDYGGADIMQGRRLNIQDLRPKTQDLN